MRVNMNIVPTTTKLGIFKKANVSEIKLDIQFTEEEKYKIKKLGLGDYKFLDVPRLAADSTGRERFGNSIEVYIRDLVKGKLPYLYYDNLMEANQACNHIEEQFRLLKQHLTDEAPASRSLDL